MYKKGQSIFFGIMMAVVIIIAVINMIQPMKDSVIDARSSTKLNCSDPNLSTGLKAACIQIDWSLFAFIGAGLSAAIAYIVYTKRK